MNAATYEVDQARRQFARVMGRALQEGQRAHARTEAPKPNGALRRKILRSLTAKAVAEKCADAYSFDRYRSWEAVAALLFARGYSAREAEAIMRSKWTRWAADMSGAKYGRVPAKAVEKMLDTMSPEKRRAEVAQLVAETFANVED